jgi:exo-beta-1,3-glucanase (GH17 family)
LIARRCAVFLALIVCLFSISHVTAKEVPLGGLAYNPSGMSDAVKQDAGPSTTRIHDDLVKLAPLTPEVRTYSVDGDLDQVAALAKPLKLKVTLGLWLGKDPKHNAAEIARGLAAVHANPDVIARIVVGNEALQHGYMTHEALIAAIREVRQGLGDRHIPVGTAEIWSIWGDAHDLAKASDFIGVHILPYWDGVGIGEAVTYVARRYDDLAHAYPGKPIVVLEAGWPSAGPIRQGAVASPENQARFTKGFTALAKARGFKYFLFEAYDQPWKVREGDTALWGLFDVNRVPKPAAMQLLQR